MILGQNLDPSAPRGLELPWIEAFLSLRVPGASQRAREVAPPGRHHLSGVCEARDGIRTRVDLFCEFPGG